MAKLTREQIIHVIGQIDDGRVAEIMSVGATIDELIEANTWLADGDALKRPLGGVVARLVDILRADEPEPDER